MKKSARDIRREGDFELAFGRERGGEKKERKRTEGKEERLVKWNVFVVKESKSAWG